MLERAPRSNERSCFLSEGVLIWEIVFKGGAHLEIT